MILKTYLKKHSIVLTPKQQSHLGRNVAKCFFTRNPNHPLKQVQISSNGTKMIVNDYPREFFSEKYFTDVLKRFLKKNNYGQ